MTVSAGSQARRLSGNVLIGASGGPGTCLALCFARGGSGILHVAYADSQARPLSGTVLMSFYH